MRCVVVVVVVVALMGLAGCPAPSSSAPTTLPTGTSPNAVAVVRCAEGPRLLVAASAEARLDVLDPAGLVPARSVFLGAGASPWDVAVLRHGADDDDDGDDDGDDGSRAVVTLAGSHGLALVRPCGAPTLLDTVVDTAPFDLPAPLPLRTAADADGDGDVEDVVERMTPRSPQAAVVVGEGSPELIVAFANILDVSTGVDAPMLTGPALLSRWRLSDDDDRLIQRDRFVLDGCENPGGLAVSGPATVAVACAGRFVLADAGHGKASDGAVVTVALAETPGITAAHRAAFSPGPIVVHDGAVVVGDLLDGALHRLEPVGLDGLAGVPGPGGIDSAFSVMVTDDDTLVAGWFDGRLVHDPFGASRAVAAPAGPPRGLVDLVDDGTRLWGLLTLSAELVAFDREAP